MKIQDIIEQNASPATKKQKNLQKIQGTLQQNANTCIAKLPGNKDFAVSNHALAE